MTAMTFHLWFAPLEHDAAELRRRAETDEPDHVAFAPNALGACNAWDDLMVETLEDRIVCLDVTTGERSEWRTQRDLGPARCKRITVEPPAPKPAAKKPRKGTAAPPAEAEQTLDPEPEPPAMIRVDVWLAPRDVTLAAAHRDCRSRHSDGHAVGVDVDACIRGWVETVGLFAPGDARTVLARRYAEGPMHCRALRYDGPGKVELVDLGSFDPHDGPADVPAAEAPPVLVGGLREERTPPPPVEPYVLTVPPPPVNIADPGPPGFVLEEAAALAAAAAVQKAPEERRKLMRLRVEQLDGAPALQLDAGCGTTEVSVRVRADDAARLRLDARSLPVCLPAARLHGILAAHDGAVWSGVLDGSILRLRSSRAKYELPTGDNSAFGAGRLPRGTPVGSRVVSGLALRRALRISTFCADPDNTRYALGGAYFELGRESVHIVTTDGRRLVASALGALANDERPAAGIVDSGGLKWIERALRGGAARLTLEESRLRVEQDGWSCTASLLEGRFPRWRDLFDDDTRGRGEPVVVTVLAGALAELVRNASLVCSGEARGIFLGFPPDKLTTAGQSELGGSALELPVTATGNVDRLAETRIKLDSRFLLDPLTRLDPHAELSLSAFGPDDPVTLRVGDDWVYRLMPLAQDE